MLLQGGTTQTAHRSADRKENCWQTLWPHGRQSHNTRKCTFLLTLIVQLPQKCVATSQCLRLWSYTTGWHSDGMQIGGRYRQYRVQAWTCIQCAEWGGWRHFTSQVSDDGNYNKHSWLEDFELIALRAGIDLAHFGNLFQFFKLGSQINFWIYLEVSQFCKSNV